MTAPLCLFALVLLLLLATSLLCCFDCAQPIELIDETWPPEYQPARALITRAGRAKRLSVFERYSTVRRLESYRALYYLFCDGRNP